MFTFTQRRLSYFRSATDEPVKDMTVDEIKAFMDEQVILGLLAH